LPPFSDEPIRVASSADGTQLAVYEVTAEPGDADLAIAAQARPPLLLIHGATADHTTWRAAGPLLARRRPVYALDRRGRGASGDAPDYAIDREFADVASVAEELARRSPDGRWHAHVVGHSFGGRCGLGGSLLTPAIGRVVVYEGAPAPPGVSYRPDGLVEAVRAALERNDHEGALTTFLQGIVGMSDAELDAYRANPVWPDRVAAAHTILREIEAEASPLASIDALRFARVPVLLVLGSASRSPFRLGTEALAAALRDVEIVTIDGAAHAAHHTHVDEFVRVVEGFLDRATAGPSLSSRA
jgi:pimeloyl-ACP methyl ester carboxylesterase